MLPHFDKYAPYIWSAYGIASAIIIGLIVWSIVRVSSAKKKLDEIEGKDGGDANG